MRAVSRVAGASINTVTKLLSDVGAACADYQDRTLRNLTLTDIQVDEIWAFNGANAKNVRADADPELRLGDCYTYTAIDRNAKLMPCYCLDTAPLPAPCSSWMTSPRGWPAGSN